MFLLQVQVRGRDGLPDALRAARPAEGHQDQARLHRERQGTGGQEEADLEQEAGGGGLRYQHAINN